MPAVVLLTCVMIAPVGAQTRKQEKADEKLAVIRGQIAYDKVRVKSWDNNSLVIPYNEIEAKLRQKIILPRPPYPAGYKKWTRKKIIEWEMEFVKTDAGKRYVAKNEQLLEAAHAFDIKFEKKDGAFVVYDVPPGVYGIQGRVDKEIGGTKYGFEVFGEVKVLKDVDEIVLKPMRVEVTPLMASKQKAPPIGVATYDGNRTLNLKTFEGKILFVNFWSSASPTAAAEQQMIQEMYHKLKGKYPIKLLSICVDKVPKAVLAFINKNEVGIKVKGDDGKIAVRPIGSFGFTSGADHRTIFDFGVRAFPSFWLIDKDGMIMMSQFEIAAAMRVKPDMATIVSDRIEGKDVPTPADAKVPTEAKKPSTANESKK